MDAAAKEITLQEAVILNEAVTRYVSTYFSIGDPNTSEETKRQTALESFNTYLEGKGIAEESKTVTTEKLAGLQPEEIQTIAKQINNDILPSPRAATPQESQVASGSAQSPSTETTQIASSRTERAAPTERTKISEALADPTQKLDRRGLLKDAGVATFSLLAVLGAAKGLASLNLPDLSTGSTTFPLPNNGPTTTQLEAQIAELQAQNVQKDLEIKALLEVIEKEGLQKPPSQQMRSGTGEKDITQRLKDGTGRIEEAYAKSSSSGKNPESSSPPAAHPVPSQTPAPSRLSRRNFLGRR